MRGHWFDSITPPSDQHVWEECSTCRGSGYYGSREIRGAIGHEYQNAATECFLCGGVGGRWVLPIKEAPTHE